MSRRADTQDDATLSASASGVNSKCRGCIGYVGYNIYLGSQDSRVPELLEEQGITHILMIGRDKDQNSWKSDKLKGFNAKVKFMTMFDKDLTGTSEVSEAREKYMTECFDFLTEGTTGQNRTLVHCQRGRSRSAAMVAMHLMHAHQHTVMEAMLLLLTARHDLLLQNSSIMALRTIEQERISGTDKKESFTDINLPGEVYRANIIPPQVLQKVKETNGTFAKMHMKQIAHLKGKIGQPLNDSPTSHYTSHRFKVYLGWNEIS